MQPEEETQGKPRSNNFYYLGSLITLLELWQPARDNNQAGDAALVCKLRCDFRLSQRHFRHTRSL